MSISSIIAVLAHLVLALGVLAVLYGHYQDRRSSVEAVRVAAEAEREQTQALQREVDIQQQTLNGLVEGDPFVVDLLARDRLNHQGDGEIQPPPLPDVDKPLPTRTK